MMHSAIRVIGNIGEGEDGVKIGEDGRSISLDTGSDQGGLHVSMDAVYGAEASGIDMFLGSGVQLVEDVRKGFSGVFVRLGVPAPEDLFGAEGIVKAAATKLYEGIDREDTSTLIACSCVEVDGDRVRDWGKICLSAVSTSGGLTNERKDLCAAKIPGFYLGGEKAVELGDIADEDCGVLVGEGGKAYFEKVAILPLSEPEVLDAVLEQVVSTRTTLPEGGLSRTSIVFTLYVVTNADDSCTTLRFVDVAPNARLTAEERQGQRLKDAMSISASHECLLKVLTNPMDAASYQGSKLTAMLAGWLDSVAMLTCISSGASEVEAAATKDATSFAVECRANPAGLTEKMLVQYGSKVTQLTATNMELQATVSALKAQVTATPSRAATPAASARKYSLNGRKIKVLLEAFGLPVELEGNNTVSVNGKSIGVRELVDTVEKGEDPSRASAGGGGASSGGGGDGPASSTGSGAGSKEPSTKKLKKIISDLEDELRDSKAKAKDRKDEITEKAKLIQTLTQQLTRAQTSLRHKEFQYDTLHQEKERAVEELDHSLRLTHKQHLDAVVADNTSILQQQHKLLQSVPENLRTFTASRSGLQQKFKESDIRNREERDAAMKKLSVSQKQEIKHLKLQYEHWLNVKNDQIRTFALQFNEYREEKAKQIEACEKEIVRLYDHAEKLQNILGGVELGEYSVMQSQSSVGRPTTGVILALDDNYDIRARKGPRTAATREEMALLTKSSTGKGSSRARTAPNQQRNMGLSSSMDGNFPRTVNVGGIVLPKGLRPTNPFQPESEDLSLAKQIVSKYKSLEAQTAAIQDMNFQETLEAATAGKALGVLDPKIRSQIEGMLTTSTMSREGQAFLYTSSKKREKANLEVPDENGDMGVSLEDYMPAARERVFGENDGGFYGNSGPASSDEDIANLNREIYRLKGEITRLEAAAMAEKIRSEKVVRNLQSDEVLIYIQNLETYQAKLHTQLREVSSQLHTQRVTNASLARQVDKMNRDNRFGSATESFAA